MLWALLFALLFGGSSDSPLLEYLEVQTDRINEHVLDKQRQKDILRIFDEMDDFGKQFAKERRAAKKNILKTAKKHDASVDVINMELDRLLTEADKMETAILELRFKLKEIMTRNEWNAVFKHSMP